MSASVPLNLKVLYKLHYYYYYYYYYCCCFKNFFTLGIKDPEGFGENYYCYYYYYYHYYYYFYALRSVNPEG